MALPKAVQDLAEQADRIVDQLSSDKTGEDPQGTDPETGTESTPKDPQDPQATQDPPADGNDNSTEAKPAPVVPEQTWEQRYHTLKGMYDAEVPRMHGQVRELQQQMQQLMADKAAAEAQAKQQQPEPVKSLITDHDKEAFGTDLIDLIERATESKVSTLRDKEAKLLDRIAQLEGQLGDVSERQVVSDKDRFLMGLTQKVPDWEQLNTDPGFLQWLAEVDPVYGMPRQAALTSAYEVFDVARVSAVFNSYKLLIAPKQTEQAKAKPSDQLQRQVAPTRSRAGNTTVPNDSNTKIWTQAEIGSFYDEWRRGFLDNDEAARIEKEIAAASNEGRIR